MTPMLATALPTGLASVPSPSTWESLGKLPPFSAFGTDLEAPGALAAAARQIAYNGEIILVCGDGTAYASPTALNTVLQLYSLRLAHVLYVSDSRASCERLRLAVPSLACAWSSRVNTSKPQHDGVLVAKWWVGDWLVGGWRARLRLTRCRERTARHLRGGRRRRGSDVALEHEREAAVLRRERVVELLLARQLALALALDPLPAVHASGSGVKPGPAGIGRASGSAMRRAQVPEVRRVAEYDRRVRRHACLLVVRIRRVACHEHALALELPNQAGAHTASQRVRIVATQPTTAASALTLPAHRRHAATAPPRRHRAAAGAPPPRAWL